jgi:hypothetical protein
MSTSHVFTERGEINRPRSWHPLIVDESEDRLVWVRSKSFVLSPGAPIPIVTWTNDDWMINTLIAPRPVLSHRLQQSGLRFEEIRCRSRHRTDGCSQPDHSAGTGLGQGILFAGASDHQSTCFCIRPGLTSPRVMEIKDQLSAMFLHPAAPTEVAPKENNKVA